MPLRAAIAACRKAGVHATTATLLKMLDAQALLALRALRDLINPEVEKVRIDSRSTWEKAQQFAHKYIPDQRSSIEYYPGERPIFDLYGVEDEIQRALQRKVDYMEFYGRNFGNAEMNTL